MMDSLWVLVVESDAHNLMMISQMLQDLGIHYKRNTTGIDVLRQSLRMSPRPNFILLDLQLPSDNAYDILIAMRAHPELAQIPIISISDQADGASLAYEAGFDGHLPKPLPRRELGDLIRRVLHGERVWMQSA